VMDVAAFDGPHRFKTVQCRFGCSQGSKALAVSEQPFQSRMVAFD